LCFVTSFQHKLRQVPDRWLSERSADMRENMEVGTIQLTDPESTFFKLGTETVEMMRLAGPKKQ